MENDLFTPDELAYDLWHGKMPNYQYEINKQWLNEVFRVLTENGVWGWPDAKRAFRKTNGFFVETAFVEPQ